MDQTIMLKIEKLLLIIALLVLKGSVTFASLTIFSSENSASFSIALPKESFDFSDMDLRDNQNRPIQSSSAREEFRQLFTRSLNEMLLNSLTPTKRMVLLFIFQKWDESSQWFKKAINFINECLTGNWKDSKLRKLIRSVIVGRTLDFKPDASPFSSIRSHFVYFVSFLISTTRLLR